MHRQSNVVDTTTLAVAYYLNGVNFRTSAERLQDGIELDEIGRPKHLTGLPIYYLASQAAELFLKAALLKRGVTENELRDFNTRHHLQNLLDKLQEHGVSASQETIDILSGLSNQHNHHHLRYTVLLDNGEKTYLPPLKLLFSALDELFSFTRLGSGKH